MIGLGLAAVGRPGYLNASRDADLPASRSVEALRVRTHQLLDEAYALEVTVDGAPLFRSVQATWNLLEPSVGEALAAAHASGCQVIVKEAVANGRLAIGGPAELSTVAAELDTGPDAVALAAALRQPWATIVLSGAATLAQLRSNVRAVALRLTPEQLARVGSLAEAPDLYWQQRSERPWT